MQAAGQASYTYSRALFPNINFLEALFRRRSPAVSKAGDMLACRQLDEASYKKLERLFDMAMSDPLNDRDAPPQALIRAKNRVRCKECSPLLIWHPPRGHAK